MTRQYVFSLILYGLAIAASLWNETAGLTLCVCFTFLYLIEPKKPTYTDEENND